MERSIWIVGIFAWLLFIGAGATGYAIQDPSQNELHLGLSLAAGVLLGFTQLWFVVYLALSVRSLSRHLGSEDPVLRRARWHRRRVLPLALLTVVGMLVLVVLGTWLPIRSGISTYHHALAWMTLGAALAALVVERRAAWDYRQLMREVHDRIGEASPA